MKSHSEAIDKAADVYDDCWHESYDEITSDKEAAEKIVSAYLSHFGMSFIDFINAEHEWSKKNGMER